RLAAAWGASKTADNAEAAYWLGRASLQLDRPDETLAVAKAVIALEPADAARFELLVADALLASDDRQAEAADAFERFAAARPEAAAAPRALLLAAKTAQKFGDNERAERLSSTLLTRHAADPLAVDARSVFAAALLGQKSFAAAAEQFDRLAAEHSGDPRAARWLLRAAGAWREAGSDDKSLAAYTKLVEQHPSDPLVARARYDRGRLLTKAGELAASNADFQAVVEGAPGSELAAYAALALATNHYAAGEREACIAVLTRLLQGGGSPLRGKAYYLLATAQHAVGEHAAALESLDAAEAPPAGLSLLEARCLIGLGKGNVASAAVAGHLELHPTSEAAGELLYELAWMHRDAGRDDEALAAFQRVVNDYAETPAAAEASFRSGEIYSEASRHAEAAVAFGEAARLATQATDRDAELIEQSLHLRGWAHWKAGERDAAASAFEQQLQAAPEGVFAIEGWLMLGESRFALQRYAEALAAYERGLATDDGGRRLLPLSLLHAGQAAGQSGDWATSLQLLERARRWV
ncbi:MAG: tetratricopeptide repeat protein, partial [Planctomycetota bacterium]